MSVTRSTAVALATALFGGLAATTVRYVFVNTFLSGGFGRMDEACVAGAEYALPYTHVWIVDQIVCRLVALLQAALVPETAPYLYNSLYLVVPVLVLIAVEASRNEKPTGFIAYPGIVASCWQVSTWAFVLSIYSLSFVKQIALHDYTSPRSSFISEARASAILISTAVGTALFYYMCYLENPYMTALWPLFPAICTVTQHVSHHYLAKTEAKERSGHVMVITAYAMTIVIAAPYHWGLLYPRWNDAKAFWDLFGATTVPLDPKTAQLPEIMSNLLHWDVPIGSFAILFATLWFARSGAQLFGLTLAAILGTVTTGPAAALAFIMIWRELKLTRQSHPRPSDELNIKEKGGL